MSNLTYLYNNMTTQFNILNIKKKYNEIYLNSVIMNVNHPDEKISTLIGDTFIITYREQDINDACIELRNAALHMKYVIDEYHQLKYEERQIAYALVDTIKEAIIYAKNIYCIKAKNAPIKKIYCIKNNDEIPLFETCRCHYLQSISEAIHKWDMYLSVGYFNKILQIKYDKKKYNNYIQNSFK